MRNLSLNEMENVSGGAGPKIPWEICAAAFGISLLGPIGTLIGGPTSLGCLLAGESIL